MEHAVPLASRVLIPFIQGLSLLVFTLFLGLLIQRFIRETRAAWQRKRAQALLPLILGYADGDREFDDVENAIGSRDRVVLKQLLLDLIIEVKGEFRARLAHLFLDFGFVLEEIKRLRSKQPWIREDAASNLGLMNSKRAIVPLRTLLSDPSDEVRLNAARSLGALGDAEALPYVLESLGASSRWIITSIEEIVLSIGEKANLYLLDYIKANDQVDVQVLQMVLELLGFLRVREATEEIAHYLTSDELELRIAAAKALGDLADPETGEALLPLLRDHCWEVRAQAAKAFAHLQMDSAIPPLSECLRDRNWWVRFNAAHTLRVSGNDGVDALERALKGKDPFARDIAREALESKQSGQI